MPGSVNTTWKYLNGEDAVEPLLDPAARAATDIWGNDGCGTNVGRPLKPHDVQNLQVTAEHGRVRQAITSRARCGLPRVEHVLVFEGRDR